MKLNKYVKAYAKQFSLKCEYYRKIGVSALCDNSKVVAWYSMKDPNTFNYLADNGVWKKCKTSDMALVVMNEIKIH